MAPGVVEHEECEAMGAERCVYRVRWEPLPDAGGSDTAMFGVKRETRARTLGSAARRWYERSGEKAGLRD
jgi:hypothetical protein